MRPPARLLHVALALVHKVQLRRQVTQVVTPARRRVGLGVVLERQIPERDLVGSEAAAEENNRRAASGGGGRRRRAAALVCAPVDEADGEGRGADREEREQDVEELDDLLRLLGPQRRPAARGGRAELVGEPNVSWTCVTAVPQAGGRARRVRGNVSR